MTTSLTPIETSMLQATLCGDLAAAEVFGLHLPQTECSVVHRFAPGLYIREVHMPAGTFAIGHAQRLPHLNMFLQGAVQVIHPNGSTEVLRAPMQFVGQPGRKVGYILEDVIWQNIYATTETDIAALEAMFIDKSGQWEASEQSRLQLATAKHQADRDDYAAILKANGISEAAARSESCTTHDLCPFPDGSYKCKVGPSPIEGQGLFATAHIAAGEIIAPALIGLLRTPAGRFTNHSRNPNAAVVKHPDHSLSLMALRPIAGCHGGQDGEEITINYLQAFSEAARKEPVCLQSQ